MNDTDHILGLFQGLLERLGFNPRARCGAVLAPVAEADAAPGYPRPLCPDCVKRARWVACGCGDFHPRRAARHCADANVRHG
jgi:arylamine N-acetyltransferase